MSFCVLILSKKENIYVKYLNKEINNSYVIYDTSYSDKQCLSNGFYGLTKSVKIPSAWDKTFYFLNKNKELLDNHDYFFFIEDDVYTRNIVTLLNCLSECDNEYPCDLLSFFIESRKQSPSWYWWSEMHIPKGFNTKSFNPFCRLSSRLIKDVLMYRDENNKFLFHELLFASISCINNYKLIDVNFTPLKNKYFGLFIYRPLVDEKEINDDKLYHPVKIEY